VGTQHQQLLISIGSGGTTPAAADDYEVGAQHQEVLFSIRSGNTTPAATGLLGNGDATAATNGDCRKWEHNTSSY